MAIGSLATSAFAANQYENTAAGGFPAGAVDIAEDAFASDCVSQNGTIDDRLLLFEIKFENVAIKVRCCEAALIKAATSHA